MPPQPWDFVLGEIVSSEATYVRQLTALRQLVIVSAQTDAARIPPALLQGAVGRIDALADAHASLLDHLTTAARAADPLSATLAVFVRAHPSADSPLARLYRSHIALTSPQAVAALAANPAFAALFADALPQLEAAVGTPFPGPTLASFAILPAQRPPRYELLLKQVLAHAPADVQQCYAAANAGAASLEDSAALLDASGAPAWALLLRALDRVRGLCEMVNESKRAADRVATAATLYAEKLRGFDLLQHRPLSLSLSGELVKRGRTLLHANSTRFFALFEGGVLAWSDGRDYRGHVELAPPAAVEDVSARIPRTLKVATPAKVMLLTAPDDASFAAWRDRLTAAVRDAAAAASASKSEDIAAAALLEGKHDDDLVAEARRQAAAELAKAGLAVASPAVSLTASAGGVSVMSADGRRSRLAQLAASAARPASRAESLSGSSVDPGARHVKRHSTSFLVPLASPEAAAAATKAEAAFAPQPQPPAHGAHHYHAPATATQSSAASPAVGALARYAEHSLRSTTPLPSHLGAVEHGDGALAQGLRVATPSTQAQLVAGGLMSKPLDVGRAMAFVRERRASRANSRTQSPAPGAEEAPAPVGYIATPAASAAVPASFGIISPPNNAAIPPLPGARASALASRAARSAFAAVATRVRFSVTSAMAKLDALARTEREAVLDVQADVAALAVAVERLARDTDKPW